MDRIDFSIIFCPSSDDLINVAAHRLGTGLIEQAVVGHPSVVECCVVGAPDPAKGQSPFAVVVATAKAREGKDEASMLQAMLADINGHVRAEVGPIAQLSGIVVTEKLPKTKSGKTLRRSIRAMVENAANGVKGERFRTLRGTTTRLLTIGPPPPLSLADGNVPFPPTIEDQSVLPVVQQSIEAHFAALKKGGRAKL